MASEVEICNLALSRLGDSATVSSINPPEGSAQAEYCATFYPAARDELLEMHAWGFATVRTKPARLEGAWDYVLPGNCLRVLNVSGYGDWTMGLSEEGRRILHAEHEISEISYIARVTDTTLFSPLFTAALSWHLSSMLAGIVIKGDVGAQMGAMCAQQAMQALQAAKNADALQQQRTRPHMAPWMKDR